MPVKKVQPGAAARHSASAHNAFADVANWFQGTGGFPGNPLPPATGWRGDVVRIFNYSGEHCAAYDVLAIDDVLITPEDVQVTGGDNPNPMRWAGNVLLKGVTPALSSDYKHIGNFAVLLEPIPHRDEEPKASGWAIVSGLTVAQLDMVYEDHPRADVADGTRRLTSNWYGAAQIRYKQQHHNALR